MPTHQDQIRDEPNRPVTLADQDVAALIGLLAADAGDQGLTRALDEMNQRLRVARGEYDAVP